MSGRRVVAGLLAMMLGVALISILPGAMPAFADLPLSDSAMTKSGTGEFNNLKVTVSQTKNLINQVVTVSWTGGVPTTPIGGFSRNYLQIMQCWGDDPNGPDRTQCQFGGANTLQGGNWVQSRQVSYGSSLVDHEETLKPPENAFNAFVPFWPEGKEKPAGSAAGDNNDFFDAQITNEDSLARTHGDGTGLEYVEIQTVRQSAGLGCGDAVTVGGVTKGRSCWLVVVPRGETEVDGSTRTDTATGRLQSSPLSQTNWDKRIVFPLEFLPVGQACPIGAPERRIIGNELVADAVSSWQPALCSGGGALYSYTQLADDVARNQLVGGTSPGFALVTNPVSPDQAPADHPMVYAPVGLSGLAIAFNIDHQPPDPTDPSAPPTPEQQLAGQRFTSMKLTPRLVAKLLTQSYAAAVQVPSDAMNQHNPLGLLFDQEFLDLNPEYKGFASNVTPAPDPLVQLGTADVTSLLWSWVKSDPDASAFIAGHPDPYGMVVNPNNQNLQLPTSTFPRNDQSCIERIIGPGGEKGNFCTQDTHPFTTDMHDAGRAASRGDTEGRTIVDKNGVPGPAAVGRQLAGKRAMLAVVDVATATRYGLPMAALRNSAGQFVAPATTSLQAGTAAMKPSAVAGVLASDPGARDPAAYPLPALTYGVTSPSTLDVAAGKDYAAFLRYAAGPGQQPGINPGQLPLGMAPLPDRLKAQTIAAAATIEAQAGKPPPGSPTQQQTNAAAVTGITSDTTGSNTGSNAGSNIAAGPGGAGTPAGSGSSASVAPAAAGSANGSSKTPNVAQQVAGLLRRTPALPAPVWIGGLLIALLICGGLAATSSPVLQSPAIHWLRAVVRRRLRKGVGPTEQ